MTFWNKLGDKLLESRPPRPKYTEEELMVRLKFFIGICLALTLIGIVFVVLYSIIFVTQPLNAISPIDSKFFELIIPVATFLCGTLSGIMLAGSGQDAMRQGAALRQSSIGAAGPVSSARVEPKLDNGSLAPAFPASTTMGGTTVPMTVPARPVPPPPPGSITQPPPPTRPEPPVF